MYCTSLLSYSMSLPCVSGTLVTIASATDADSGDNALITYSLTNSDQLPFQIDPFNGEVSGSLYILYILIYIFIYTDVSVRIGIYHDIYWYIVILLYTTAPNHLKSFHNSSLTCRKLNLPMSFWQQNGHQNGQLS